MTRFVVLAAFVALLFAAPEVARACAVAEGCPMYDEPPPTGMQLLEEGVGDLVDLLEELFLREEEQPCCAPPHVS